MVGIPRSKGCRTCVTRRVRCDLGKPTCQNCAKGNRECLYSEGLKFVNEATKLKRKFEHRDKDQDAGGSLLVFETDATTSSSNNATTESLEDSSPEDQLTPFTYGSNPTNEPVHYKENAVLSFVEKSSWMPATETLDFGIQAYNDDVLEDASNGLHSHANDMDIAAMILAPNLIQDQLFSMMHRSMFPPAQVDSVPQQMKSHGLWFKRLPPLTGTNKLLDSAVRAVSLAHMGRLQGNRSILEESRPWYGSTLRQLNSAIADGTAGMAPETLAATILLSFYEMFASNSNASWVQHAGGAGALMRIRGPDVHRFGFDREMYIAYRHTIIIEAAQRDEPCFLAEPEWRELSRSIFHDLRMLGEERFRETFDLAEQQYENMLDVPELLHRCKHFHKFQSLEKDQYPTIRDFVFDLIQRVQQIRARFRTYFVRFRGALAKTGFMWTTYLSHDPVIPIYYQFPNIFVGSSVTGYWTLNILLNLVLIELMQKHDPEKCSLYRAENRDSALEICRSVRFMLSSSFLGPFFIIFGLRISLSALQEKEEREWVIARLFEMSETHMAMAAHIPGFEAGADMPRVRAALSSSNSKVIELFTDG
ncbi:uncharacterized protein AB675_10024 [Cyphellophora attinorum]|uniref:Zn(2)-C6 fungal-type domain-containing protein n=1 Tax=Cyphellophora attinorum TaxID=1664694 RepID=A0A0N0NJA2_9EURO|nr:uncharacterized protein AB675_10024 [Phialophora attinorum]KPI36678.1 hypothetical protein AB675_10024 [Phialophora attinorum]